MKVETYEVTEHDEHGAEMQDAEQTLAIIEACGLDGQRQFLKPKEQGEVATVPFRVMTSEELLVYGVLMPKKSNVLTYKDSLIPIRVLGLIALYRDAFVKLEVWHPESAADIMTDPILVGYLDNAPNAPPYMLARWGECLDSLPVLKARASVIAKKRAIAACHEIIAQLETHVAKVGAVPDETYLDLYTTEMPWFYYNARLSR